MESVDKFIELVFIIVQNADVQFQENHCRSDVESTYEFESCFRTKVSNAVFIISCILITGHDQYHAFENSAEDSHSYS